jgi:hypothetical protein
MTKDSFAGLPLPMLPDVPENLSAVSMNVIALYVTG